MAASDEDVENMPLSMAYEWASQLLDAADTGAASQSSEGALRLLSHCESLIERAALFSSNEDADDLVTCHLKYLLVPFLKAELLNTQTVPDPSQRLHNLQEAAVSYSQYLQRCHQYGFLKGTCREAYTNEEQGTTPDPGTCRNQRIERFKRSKAVNGLVQQMKARRKAADEEAGTEGGPPGGVGGWDEEDERQLWQLQLEAAAIKGLDARPLLRQEMQLLQHAVRQQRQQQEQGPGRQQQQQGPGAGQGDGRQRGQQRQQLQQQMMEKLAGIAGQLTLGADRQAIRQQVFRPSHILPSLTVEQQGMIELREAREREARQKEAERAAAARKAELRSDDEDEEELARTRAMDDFKDDNPRGWGNSKLRPCA